MGDEPIYRDGRLAGTLASAAHGHTLGRAVGMGYVECAPGAPAAAVLEGRYEIDLAGVRVPATAPCGSGTIRPGRGCAPEE